MEIKQGVDQLKDAAGEAIKSIRRASGLTNDVDLMRYERLSDGDFEQLSRDFGVDSVMTYIREMETKRLMPKK